MRGHSLELSVDELIARSRVLAGVEMVDDEIVEELVSVLALLLQQLPGQE